jgi:hypothetical protein
VYLPTPTKCFFLFSRSRSQNLILSGKIATLKILNHNELKLVAGGTTCPAEHNGQLFDSAEFWLGVSNLKGAVSFIKCFYGDEKKPGVTFDYTKVTKRDPKYWPLVGGTQLYHIYACTRNYASCDFVMEGS